MEIATGNVRLWFLYFLFIHFLGRVFSPSPCSGLKRMASNLAQKTDHVQTTKNRPPSEAISLERSVSLRHMTCRVWTWWKLQHQRRLFVWLGFRYFVGSKKTWVPFHVLLNKGIYPMISILFGGQRGKMVGTWTYSNHSMLRNRLKSLCLKNFRKAKILIGNHELLCFFPLSLRHPQKEVHQIANGAGIGNFFEQWKKGTILPSYIGIIKSH